MDFINAISAVAIILFIISFTVGMYMDTHSPTVHTVHTVPPWLWVAAITGGTWLLFG